MFKGLLSVKRGINVNAFNLAAKLMFQCLQGQQVVAEDQPVVEQILLCHPITRMVRQILILQQDARLQSRPILLANPGQFEFLFLHP